MASEQTGFDKKRMTAIVMGIAVLAMALTVASKLVKETSSPPVSPPATAAVVSPPIPTGNTPGTPESTPEEDAATTAAFAGSSWTVDDISASLEPGGLLKVRTPKLPITLEGSWTVKGKTMTLSAMGKTFSLQIDGDKLVKDGKTLTRVQK